MVYKHNFTIILGTDIDNIILNAANAANAASSNDITNDKIPEEFKNLSILRAGLINQLTLKIFAPEINKDKTCYHCQHCLQSSQRSIDYENIHTYKQILQNARNIELLCAIMISGK